LRSFNHRESGNIFVHNVQKQQSFYIVQFVLNKPVKEEYKPGPPLFMDKGGPGLFLRDY